MGNGQWFSREVSSLYLLKLWSLFFSFCSQSKGKRQKYAVIFSPQVLIYQARIKILIMLIASFIFIVDTGYRNLTCFITLSSLFLPRNPWGKDPFNKLAIHNTKYEDSEEAKAPLEQVEFLVPSLATSNGTWVIANYANWFQFILTINTGEFGVIYCWRFSLN